MSSMEKKKQPKPRTLNQTKLIDAAFEVLDERGMSGLTLKVLAQKLDVQAPALYKHFLNKDALYIAMTQRLFDAWADSVKQARETPWETLLKTYAFECRKTIMSYRDGAWLFTKYHQFVHTDFSSYMLASLRQQGFSPADAVYASSTLLSYVVGFTLEEDFDSYAKAIGRERLDKKDTPEELLDYVQNPDKEFTYGVDCILAGIKARCK